MEERFHGCLILVENKVFSYDIIHASSIVTSVHALPHPRHPKCIVINRFSSLFVGHFRENMK